MLTINRLHRYIGLFICMVFAGGLLVGWLVFRAIQTDSYFEESDMSETESVITP